MSIFSEIQGKKPSYNTFNLSYDRKLSLNMGKLVPIHVMETVPGDKITMSTSQMMRFAPMIAPVMHNVNVYTHFFFVPNRLVWSNWEDFITGGEDGESTASLPYIPYVSDGSDVGGLADHLGLPAQTNGSTINVNAIPFAAYNLIYNDYYRDQNLIDKVDVQLTDGNNTGNIDFNLKDRAWQHDYFTSALPWTQKGPEATIPILGTADIVWSDNVADVPRRVTDGAAIGNSAITSNNFKLYGDGLDISIDNSANLSADLGTATASTINDLRRAFKLQEWLEKNARGGSRYIESIMSHFGVKSSDARLQRPEFLGGGSTPVVISEVLQTSSTDATTPQGNMAGHGISVGANNNFSYRCEEHGYIIGIMSVMPKTAYQQGIPKHFLKFDKFDYYWPSFAHLGEQPIQNQEIYLDNDGENENTFGYTPRYAEYKYNNSTVHGDFKTSLDFWHMGRIFANRPALNATFINANPTTRIFAVETEDVLWAHVFHNIKATRPMPYFGTPKI